MKTLLVACLTLGALTPLGAAQAATGPDLIIDTATLQHQWLVRDENLPADYCSVIEGASPPGLHRLIRFTVTTPTSATPTSTSAIRGRTSTPTTASSSSPPATQHYHFRNYARYELIDPATGKVWKAAKRGFCMLDTDPNPPTWARRRARGRQELRHADAAPATRGSATAGRTRTASTSAASTSCSTAATASRSSRRATT